MRLFTWLKYWTRCFECIGDSWWQLVTLSPTSYLRSLYGGQHPTILGQSLTFFNVSTNLAFPSPSHAYSLYDGQPTLVNNVRHKMINYNGEKWFVVTLWQINYTKCICNMTAYLWKWNMTNQQVIDHVPGVFWTQEVVHIGVDVRYAVWWSVQENVINGRREFL